MKLVAATVLASLIASPVLAQSREIDLFCAVSDTVGFSLENRGTEFQRQEYGLERYTVRISPDQRSAQIASGSVSVTREYSCRPYLKDENIIKCDTSEYNFVLNLMNLRFETAILGGWGGNDVYVSIVSYGTCEVL